MNKLGPHELRLDDGALAGLPDKFAKILASVRCECCAKNIPVQVGAPKKPLPERKIAWRQRWLAMKPLWDAKRVLRKVRDLHRMAGRPLTMSDACGERGLGWISRDEYRRLAKDGPVTVRHLIPAMEKWIAEEAARQPWWANPNQPRDASSRFQRKRR
jgi:hypothetical protein